MSLSGIMSSMRALELKVPPVAVALLVAGAMWALARYTVPVDVPASIARAASATLALAGLGIGVAGIVAFRRARTTVHPMRPESASALVATGVFRYTRNPMYLGLALVLVAWALWLSSVWSLSGPVAFVLYMNRFQIVPEERALSALFGAEYAAYRSRVGRWL